MQATKMAQLRVKPLAVAGGAAGRGPQRLHCVPTWTRLPNLLIKLGLSCSSTSGRPLPQQPCSRRVVVLSSAAEAEADLLDDDLEDIGLGGASTFDESELGPPPAVRYQRAMHIKERKGLRAKAENLAKDKKLLKIQVGQLGITVPFLRASADILQKHSLLRVKLGEGCGLERREAAALLEKYLDCVCVHQIGFTITLYRQLGLPRPSNLVKDDDPAIAAEAAAVAQQAEESAAAAVREKEAKKRAGQKRPEDRPPEFSVL